MNYVRCPNLTTLMAWAIQRAMPAGTVIAVLTPYSSHVILALETLHRILTLAGMDYSYLIQTRTVTLCGGGVIRFYSYDCAEHQHGAAFSDVAIYGLSLRSAEGPSFDRFGLIHQMQCRLRKRRPDGAENLMAFAD